jgi:hypothetical protein
LDPQDRIFNPSRETIRLMTRLAKIGPHTAQLGDLLFRTQCQRSPLWSQSRIGVMEPAQDRRYGASA